MHYTLHSYIILQQTMYLIYLELIYDEKVKLKRPDFGIGIIVFKIHY